MEKYMLEKLENVEKNNYIVSLFDDRNNPDSWNTGFIEAITKNEIMVKSISREGRYNGYIVRCLDDIFRLDIGGIYEKRILKQYEILKQSHKNLLKDKVNIEDNLFKEALKVSKYENYIVSICLINSENEESVQGLVKEVNDNMAVISKISYDGFYDGESSIYINDIIFLDCDTSEENICKLLWENKIQL